MKKSNQDFSFQLRQRYHPNLFEAIKLIFDTNRKIEVYKENYMQFSVSSIKDIEKVVQFFSFSNNHPLMGSKLLQYEN